MANGNSLTHPVDEDGITLPPAFTKVRKDHMFDELRGAHAAVATSIIALQVQAEVPNQEHIARIAVLLGRAADSLWRLVGDLDDTLATDDEMLPAERRYV